MSPELEGGFFTTEPPGQAKSSNLKGAHSSLLEQP